MDPAKIPELIAAANKFILDNDRRLYYPYFETAEKFCAENDIVIGGNIGIDLLIGKPMHKDSQPWDVYCANPYGVAKSLTDALYDTKNPHIDNKTINLQTNIKNRELTIHIDARYMFKIYLMDKYRGVDLVKVMNPVTVKGYFGNNVLVFPREIVLVSLYQYLYSPAKFAQWGDIIAKEESVWGTGSEVTPLAEITGGFDKTYAVDLIVKKLLKGENMAVIGDFAAASLGITIKANRLQFLTDIPIDDVINMTSRVLNAEKDRLRKIKISHDKITKVAYNVNIPSDFQIIKYTVYAVVGDEQIALYDMFNSPVYEMIPFTDIAGIKYAHPFVLLRFFFIDIWLLKLIMGVNKDNLLTNRIAAIHGILKQVRNAAIKLPFQLNNYIGVNTSEAVAKKKIISQGFRIPSYYPALKSESTSEN